MKAKLTQLASQLDDVMHQAEFMANWIQDNRLNRQQIDNEFNILIAEIWDSKVQVNELLQATQGKAYSPLNGNHWEPTSNKETTA